MKEKILKEMRDGSVQEVNAVRISLKEHKIPHPERLSMDIILFYATEVCQNQQLFAEIMARDTIRLIQIVNKRRRVFFGGKSEKGLLSGLFYFLCIKYGIVKSQKEIARCLKTTEATVRSSYRDWRTNFPDLFPKMNH